jgi:hypothetical protein
MAKGASLMRRAHFGHVIAVVALSFLLQACGTARTTQFASFAKAGVTYADAVPPLLEDAIASSLGADTIVLRQARPQLARADRIKRLSESSRALRARIALFDDFRQHTGLLRAYFVALGNIAASDADTGLGDVTTSIVTNLGKLSPRLKDAKVRVGTTEVPVADFTGQAVKLAVAAYQSAVLERELKRHAPLIERELDLQHALIRAVVEAMKSDFQLELNEAETNLVYRPYVNEGQLPDNWNDRRLEIFRKQADMRRAEAAASAAKNLHISFVALVENRLDAAGVSLLLNDVNNLVVFLERFRDTKAKENAGKPK